MYSKTQQLLAWYCFASFQNICLALQANDHGRVIFFKGSGPLRTPTKQKSFNIIGYNLDTDLRVEAHCGISALGMGFSVSATVGVIGVPLLCAR